MNHNYKRKYEKYKYKYLELKNKQTGGADWPPKYDAVSFNSEIDSIKGTAHKAAYDLLIELYNKKDYSLNIATAESLTAGLIFSTLVDIPFGGSYKYGCFSVYDTDAKRVMLGVKVKDVYTHKCAKEMAIGILRNSNASLAIAVTGNAMPVSGDEDKIGEVFIGIAGYTSNDTITVSTKVYNFCLDKSTCKLWNIVPKEEEKVRQSLPEAIRDQLADRTIDGFNDLQITSLVSQYIRYATVEQSLKDCREFILKHQLVVPDFIQNNRIETDDKIDINKLNQMSVDTNNKMLTIPQLNIICDNADECDDDMRQFSKLFTQTN